MTTGGDESARTMRIDIHPDFLGASLARQKQRAEPRPPRPEDTSVIARRVRSESPDSTYKKLLQSIYDAVLITNLKGRVFDFNQRALDFFFCEEDELYGGSILEFISGADEALLESIRANLEDHRYTLIEAHCVRRDKSTFPAEVAVNLIDLDEEGQLCFLVRDISIRKRAQDALKEAVTRLEEHDRAKSQFVSNVSHELRTPLTSMIYAVHNLLRGVAGPLSDDLRRYLELLLNDSRRLLGTVNDILDLRKIENRTLTLARTRVPLARIIERSVETLMPQVEQKGLRLTFRPGAGRYFIDCDVQKMERVFINIVGNAVKFTPDGGAVDIVLEPSAAGDGVTIRIVDTGIGIPPEAINRLGERYFTVVEQASGSGLGLAISRELVQLHGGTIQFESPPQGARSGTGVYVTMPTVEAPVILVADDDDGVRKVLAGQIGGHGYKVMLVHTGAEALAAVYRDRPALLVADILLPDMAGTELILKMRSDKAVAWIPILVLTGVHVDRAKAEILNSFSIPAMTKPWDESELLDAIEGAFLGNAPFRRLAVFRPG